MAQSCTRRQAVAALTATLLASRPQPLAASPQELVLGVVPFASPPQIVGRLAPIVSSLTHALGSAISLRSAPDYAQFLARLESGAFDIALAPLHLAARAAERGACRPLYELPCSREAHFVVLDGSPWRSVRSMAGCRIALPDPLSLVSILGRIYLERVPALRSADISYIGNLSNAVERVRRGLADATIAPESFLAAYARTEGRLFRPLASIPGRYSLVFVLDRLADRALEDALVRLANDMRDEPDRFAAAFWQGGSKLVPAREEELAGYARLLDRELARSGSG